MTIADRVSGAIADRQMKFENAGRLTDFVRLAQCLMTNKGLGNAVLSASALPREARAKIIPIIEQEAYLAKAVTSPLTLVGGAFADYGILATAFVNSLVNASCFDALLPSMVAVPLVTATVGSVSIGSVAYSVNESEMKPLSRLSLVNQQMNAAKAHVLITVTDELARSNDGASVQLIARQMRLSVAVQTDAKFLATITSGITTIPSAGTSPAAIKSDLSNLFQNVGSGVGSKLFFITTPLVAKMLSTMLSDGIYASVQPTGGHINQIPLLISDGVNVGQILLVDASGLAGNGGTVFLEQTDAILQQMDSNPDSPPIGTTNFVSLFQLNLLGLRCERYFVAARLRPDSIAVLQTSNSYQGGSP